MSVSVDLIKPSHYTCLRKCGLSFLYELSGKTQKIYLKAAKQTPGLPQWVSSKESVCIAGDTGDMSLIPGLGRSLGGGNGNALQYSCLKNRLATEAWWATVHGVTKSRTRLSTHARTHMYTVYTLVPHSI